MADLNSLDPNFTPDVNGALSAPQVAEPQEAPKSRYNTFLMQKGSNALVEVPQDELDVAIRSGEYLPKKDASFIVRDAEGQTYNVLGENLHEALQSGLLLENSAERIKIAKSGYEYFIDNFSPKVFWKKIFDIAGVN